MMSKVNRTEAQQIYRKFNKRSKVIGTLLSAAGFAVLLSWIICIKYGEDGRIFVLLLVLLVLWFVALCTAASRLNSKRIKLYEAAYGKEDEAARSGLFGEIWEEFEWKQFEGLTDGRVIFAEAHNNTIELEILRRKHEFNITIDKDAIYMVMDEETDTPVEKEIPLAELTDVEHALTAIREFVESA